MYTGGYGRLRGEWFKNLTFYKDTSSYKMCLYFFSLKIQQLEQGKSDLEKAMKELGEVSVLTVEDQMETHHHKTSGERYLQGEVLCVWG